MATTLNLFDQYRKAVADPFRAAAVVGELKLAIFRSMVIDAAEQANWTFFSDIVGEQVVGGNYTPGGNPCAAPTWTYPTPPSGVLVFDASDPAIWLQAANGFTDGRRAILLFSTGDPATSRLVGYSNDFGADLGNVASDVAMVFSPGGIYTSNR